MSVGYQCDRRGAFEEGASQGRDVFDVDDDWFIWVDVARKKDSKKGLDLCYGCWEARGSMSKIATQSEADETWAYAEEMWAAMFKGASGPPWVRAGYIVQTFELLLKQKGLRLDSRMRVADVFYVPS